MIGEHVHLDDIYRQAAEHARALNQREQQLTGATLADHDMDRLARIKEIRVRLDFLERDARLGERPTSSILFAAITHLAALELAEQRTEMTRPEAA